ncbi:MAG: hypothetical protein JNJ76_02750 [Candidatus Competibacter sp.]|nr:hypothetical protein [Candidatus Competibacter sp.]
MTVRRRVAALETGIANAELAHLQQRFLADPASVSNHELSQLLWTVAHSLSERELLEVVRVMQDEPIYTN